jgi:hypothetical protein
MADDLDRLRAYEDEHGYVRVRLTLVSTQDGGRRGPIASGYRSCWDVSPEGGQSLLTDAPLLTEDGAWLEPGECATVRLHPLFRENWAGVVPGMVIGMFEGSRRVGLATVLDVALYGP